MRALEAAQLRTMAGMGDNAIFTREVGAPLSESIGAFAQGRPMRTVQLQRRVRNMAQRFGGSQARCGLIDLTLFEAAWVSPYTCVERGRHQLLQRERTRIAAALFPTNLIRISKLCSGAFLADLTQLQRDVRLDALVRKALETWAGCPNA